MCTVQAGPLFPTPSKPLPHALRAVEIKRRRVYTKTGDVQTKTVYAVTCGWTNITPSADHYRSTASVRMPCYP